MTERTHLRLSEIEERVWLAIAKRFGIDDTLPLDAAGAEALRRTLGLATGAIRGLGR